MKRRGFITGAAALAAYAALAKGANARMMVNQLAGFGTISDSSIIVPGIEANWAGSTASFSWTGTPVTDIDADVADRAIRSTAVLTGDFTVNATVTNTTSTTVGVFGASDIGNFSETSSGGGMATAMSTAYHVSMGATNQIKYNATNKQAYSYSTSDSLIITRVGNVISFFDGAVLAHQFVETIIEDMYVCYPNGSTASAMYDWTWTHNQ